MQLAMLAKAQDATLAGHSDIPLHFLIVTRRGFSKGAF